MQKFAVRFSLAKDGFSGPQGFERWYRYLIVPCQAWFLELLPYFPDVNWALLSNLICPSPCSDMSRVELKLECGYGGRICTSVLEV